MDQKKSKKFLWVYTIVLFSVALILVAISSIRHQEANEHAKDVEEKYNQQIVLTSGVQANLEKLQQEHEVLVQELDEVKESERQLQQQVDSLTKQNNSRSALISAQHAYEQKSYDEARQYLQQVDTTQLNEQEQQIFTDLQGKLD